MAPFTQTFLLIHLEPPDNSLPLIYQVTPSSLNDPTRLFSLKMFPNHWSAPGHKPPLMKSGMEVVLDTLWLELFPPSPHCWQRVNKGSIVTPSIELLKLVLVFGSWKYHFFPGLLQANDLEPWFLVFICFFFLIILLLMQWGVLLSLGLPGLGSARVSYVQTHDKKRHDRPHVQTEKESTATLLLFCLFYLK